MRVLQLKTQVISALGQNIDVNCHSRTLAAGV